MCYLLTIAQEYRPSQTFGLVILKVIIFCMCVCVLHARFSVFMCGSDTCTLVHPRSHVHVFQGTEIAFAQSHYDQELQSRFSLLVALAPVAYLSHVRSPIRYFAPFSRSMAFMLRIFGAGEFLPSSRLMQFLANHVCNHETVPRICSNVVFLIAGYDKSNTNVVSCISLPAIQILSIRNSVRNVFNMYLCFCNRVPDSSSAVHQAHTCGLLRSESGPLLPGEFFLRQHYDSQLVSERLIAATKNG